MRYGCKCTQNGQFVHQICTILPHVNYMPRLTPPVPTADAKNMCRSDGGITHYRIFISGIIIFSRSFFSVLVQAFQYCKNHDWYTLLYPVFEWVWASNFFLEKGTIGMEFMLLQFILLILFQFGFS